MVAWSLKCNISSYIFMSLKKILNECGTHIYLMFETIIRMPISYSRCAWSLSSSIYHYKNFIGLQRSQVNKKPGFYKFQKNHIKKQIIQKRF